MTTFASGSPNGGFCFWWSPYPGGSRSSRKLPGVPAPFDDEPGILEIALREKIAAALSLAD